MTNYISKLSRLNAQNEDVGITSKLVSNTIGEISVAKISTGQYECRSNGLFSLAKTFPYVQPSDGTTSPATAQFYTHVLDENTILIYSMDQADNSVDADFRNLSFKIENY